MKTVKEISIENINLTESEGKYTLSFESENKDLEAKELALILIHIANEIDPKFVGIEYN